MAAKRIQLDSIGRSCTTTAFMNQLHSAIQNDQEPKHKIGEDILRMYDKATPQEQEIMDKIFAFLCGHTLETLIIHAEQGKRVPLVRLKSNRGTEE